MRNDKQIDKEDKMHAEDITELRSALQAADRSVLEEIIAEFCFDNDETCSRVLDRLRPEHPCVTDLRKSVREAVEGTAVIEGPIAEYGALYRAFSDALSIADEKLEAGERRTASDIALAILSVCEEYIGDRTEHSWHMGDLVEQVSLAAVDIVRDAARKASREEYDAICRNVLRAMRASAYFESTAMNLSLMSAVSKIVTTSTKDDFLAVLDETEGLEPSLKSDLDEIRYDVLAKVDGKDAADQYMQEHAGSDSYDDDLFSGLFQRIGEKQPWEKKKKASESTALSAVFEDEDDLDEWDAPAPPAPENMDQRTADLLHQGLAMDLGNGKALALEPAITMHPSDAKQQTADAPKRNLSAADEEILLESIRLNPRELFDSGSLLLPQHADELISIGTNYIRAEAARATTRAQYREVAHWLVQLTDLSGERDRMLDLLDELANLYPRKYAMQEELLVARNWVNVMMDD